MTRSVLLPIVFLLSAAGHAGAWLVVDGEVTPDAPRPPAMVEMTVAPPKPKPAPVVPPAPPEARPAAEPPRPAQAPKARVAARTPAPPPPPSAAPPPPSAAPPEAPADFTGTTLTNSGGDGWAAHTGNGEAMAGPVGPAGAKKGPAKQPGVAGASGDGTGQAPSGPKVVAYGDLSRPPRAPDLNDELAHHYPAAARKQGLGGKAVVRARIGADGKARVLKVVSESAPGFGDACSRTLDGSRWEPPLDAGGKSVATELSYTCRFEVGS